MRGLIYEAVHSLQCEQECSTLPAGKYPLPLYLGVSSANVARLVDRGI